MKVVLSSSIVLVHPSTQHSANTPWIARLLEIEGKTRIFHPLFEDENEYPLSSNHKYFNLHNHFQLCYLSVSYHITEEKYNFSRHRFEHDKVLIFNLPKYQPFPCSINDCSRLCLSKQGRLSGFRPLLKEDGIYGISYGSVDKFDDIICFKGIVYALDRVGRLYKISVNTFRVQNVVIDKAIVKEVSTIRGYKKRLVGSILDDRLYLIIRDDLEDELRVYKMMMSYNKKKRYWIEVHSFKDSDQVLFMSRIDAYFVGASEFSMCNLKNCIIFYDAFPLYFHTSRKSSKKVKIEKEIQVFWLGRNNQNFRPISSYPNFPAGNFFSLPNWVLKTCISSCHQSPSQSECSNDKKTEPQSSSPQFGHEYEENNTGSSKMNDQKNAEDSDDNSPTNFHGQNSNAKITDRTPKLVPQACINCSSTVKFEGVDIKAELLPTLQTILVKHGTLFCEATVRNKEIRACALELLVELMISLQNTTGRSLTDYQTDEIKSVMFDLQLVGLEVGWLTPTIDKALKLQGNKVLVESMMLLDKKKARVEKEEKEFLARNAKVKQEIKEDIACLSAKVPFSKIIDLDDCLGDVLF